MYIVNRVGPYVLVNLISRDCNVVIVVAVWLIVESLLHKVVNLPIELIDSCLLQSDVGQYIG